MKNVVNFRNSPSPQTRTSSVPALPANSKNDKFTESLGSKDGSKKVSTEGKLLFPKRVLKNMLKVGIF